MAEVKIDITAKDRTDAAFSAVERHVESLAKVAGSLEERLSGFGPGIDVSGALRAIGEVRSAVDSLSLAGAFVLDVSQALAAASAVKASIDIIPDVTVKTVVLDFKTQASPVMPFTEGIRHIRSMLESLPKEGSYTVKASGLPGRAAAGGGGARHVTFSPTINIRGAGGGTGGELARELDAELARLWRYRRSELRRAMSQ